MPDLPDLPDTLTDRVAVLLQMALARAQGMGEQALTGLGISGREYGILALLEHGPTTAQHRLGGALGIDRTSTMAMLAGLQARGLLSRAPNPADRRAYLVTLTDAGEQIRARASQVLADCDDRFLAPLPADERTHLRSTLKRLL